MIKRWFVTGTDTEVGKTVASSALLQAANRAGYRSAGYKPVASGSEMTAEGLRNGDALALQANSGVALSYDEVNPYVLPNPPRRISSAPMKAGRSTRRGCPTACAGWNSAPTGCWSRARAGGLPLSAEYTFADWVQQEQLPVILLVGIKLGCINHAVLTAQAVQQAGLTLAGWIANDVAPPGRRHQEWPRCAACCRRRCWAKSRTCRRLSGRRWGSIWISAC
ncbi:dethiobiotin synthase [Serratia ureilytica]